MKKLFNWFKKFGKDTKATWFALDIFTRAMVALGAFVLIILLLALALI